MDEIKEENAQIEKSINDDPILNSQSVIEEDDSDLIYEKEVKLLVADHKQIATFLMTFSILILGLQIAFAIWCLINIYQQVDSTSEALLIIWFHILKLFHNFYLINNFIQRMKARQISSPMVALATYLTLLMYYGFLFVYMDKLSPKLDKMQLYLCGVYPASDWCLFFISWCLQRNIMARRDELFRFESTNVPMEKK